MATCKRVYKTINLSHRPCETLKELKRTIGPKDPWSKRQREDPLEKANVQPVKRGTDRKIAVCRAPHIRFTCPRTPCICPPRPGLRVGESLGNLVGFLAKVGGVLLVAQWTVGMGLWGPQDSTTQITMGPKRKLERMMKGSSAQPDQKAKAPANSRSGVFILDTRKMTYKVVQVYNKVIFLFFDCVFGMPYRAVHNGLKVVFNEDD